MYTHKYLIFLIRSAPIVQRVLSVSASQNALRAQDED